MMAKYLPKFTIMNRLTDFEYEGKLIQVTSEGMYNLTQMCQANGKQVSDFLKLKSTKAYIQETAADAQIPLAEVLIVKSGGCQHWEQGTWGHKLVAIKLARWINVKFELWCDKNIFTLMSTGKVELQAKSLENGREILERQLAPTPPPELIDKLATGFGKRFGKLYEQRYYYQQVKRHYPFLAGHTPQSNETASLPTANALLTPTKIAEQLGWKYQTGSPNARKVNKVLEHLGYQEKISKQWSATDKAINANLCDRKPVETNSRTQKDQLLWSDKVIVILQEHSTIGAN